MTRYTPLALSACLLLAGSAACEQARPAAAPAPWAQWGSPSLGASLLIENARWIDPGQRTTGAGHLLIEDGRIAAILDELPASYPGPRHDAGGRWVMPGLFDAHVHAFGNAAPGGVLERMGVEGVAGRLSQAGVTGFLDLFSDEAEIFRIRDRDRTHITWGAEIYAAGPCLTAPGGHCSEYGVPTRIVDSPAGAAAEVAELAKRRPDVVKLVYGHGFPERFATMSEETMRALIAAARERGLPSVVHIETWQDAADAVAAGASAITHAPAGDMPEELIGRMRAQRVVWIPTLTVESELLDIVNHPERLDDPFLRALATTPVIEAYRAVNQSDPEVAFFLDFQRRHGPGLLANIRRAASGGVTLAAGTDAGNLGTFVGYSLHRELELMAQAGVGPWDVLRAGTVIPAELLGARADLQPGAPANLIILEDSPLSEVRNTRRIAAVIRRGRLLSSNATAD